jgi:hypothetical protein
VALRTSNAAPFDPHKHLRRVSALIGIGLLWTISASALEPSRTRQALASAGCAALVKRVNAIPGTGPAFLPSFDAENGQGPNDNPALASAAFTYDNALAIIALLACGQEAHAKRLGDALADAATKDRAGAQGRLRNAYRAGAQDHGPLPNGWWDGARQQWLEDDYQVGTATGNVAWAALALLTLADHTHDRRYGLAAAELGHWAINHTLDKRGAGGFTGGIFGGEAIPQSLTWKSTEHNIDLEAVFRWLARTGLPGDWTKAAQTARRFIDAQWSDADGYFLIGATPDGITGNRATSGLDVQFWALLLPEAQDKWRRALAYAETAHGVAQGFAFNNDKSGMWTEGTAQAALSFLAAGQMDKAERYLNSVAQQFSPSGYLWATPQTRVSTGLMIGPNSVKPDFFYYHLPHLGPTAWAVIASKAWNPFTGRPL